MNEFVDLIKQIAINAVEASKPVKVCFGTVKSTEPLQILVDQKMLLDEESLMLTSNTANYQTKMTDGHTNFPRYELSDSAIRDIATCVTGETGGSDELACCQEASQIANLNEVTYGKSNTEAAIINTIHGGWYSPDSWTRGCTQTAIDAVKVVLVEGKRVLPRYVTEHDTFPLDILNAKSRSDYQFGDAVNNRYGSNYRFYCFFGSNGNGDIAGYFPNDLVKYETDVPWTDEVIRNNNITIQNGLVVGDTVILLRVQGGQKYVVVNKII